MFQYLIIWPHIKCNVGMLPIQNHRSGINQEREAENFLHSHSYGKQLSAVQRQQAAVVCWISFLLNTAVLILLKDLCFYSSVIDVQVIAVFTLLYSKTINPACTLFIIDLFILVELNDPSLSDFIALDQYKCTHFRKWCGVFQ